MAWRRWSLSRAEAARATPSRSHTPSIVPPRAASLSLRNGIRHHPSVSVSIRHHPSSSVINRHHPSSSVIISIVRIVSKSARQKQRGRLLHGRTPPRSCRRALPSSLCHVGSVPSERVDTLPHDCRTNPAIYSPLHRKFILRILLYTW
jgi:hypothetical protein